MERPADHLGGPQLPRYRVTKKYSNTKKSAEHVVFYDVDVCRIAGDFDWPRPYLLINILVKWNLQSWQSSPSSPVYLPIKENKGDFYNEISGCECVTWIPGRTLNLRSLEQV